MARIAIRVSTGAREDAIAGWQDDTLHVRVRARPERGKANDAVCRLIARTLAVPARNVGIATGASARRKIILIEGIDDDEVLRRFDFPPR